MKVLFEKGTTTIATVPMKHFGASQFETVEAEPRLVEAVVVAEMNEAAIKRVCALATQGDSFIRPADYMRDLRWLGKGLVDAPNGTEGVRIEANGSRTRLILPDGIKPDYKPVVGDKIAVNANISPKALMNARGEVTAVNGTKVTVTITAGDLRRVERATGKKFQPAVKLPIACVEKDEA